jgi:uncharacterized circularly permuted ATP-grasp superfamily protein
MRQSERRRLTDGRRSPARYEHRLAAAHLGDELLRVDELVRDRLLYRDGRGREHAIDVVYRRSDVERLFDEHGDPTILGELLLEFWLARRIAVVNGFGSGIGDDKLAHAYVEEMVCFYLGEEMLLRSVPTLDLTHDANLGCLLDAPKEYVVKPRHGRAAAAWWSARMPTRAPCSAAWRGCESARRRSSRSR